MNTISRKLILLLSSSLVVECVMLYKKKKPESQTDPCESNLHDRSNRSQPHYTTLNIKGEMV